MKLGLDTKAIAGLLVTVEGLLASLFNGEANFVRVEFWQFRVN